MAAVKIFDYKDMITIRVNCSCLTPEHVIDVSVDKELPEQRFYFSVNTEQEPHLWCRLKNAFKCLMGAKLCLGETILTNADAREIASFLNEHAADSRPPVP